MHLGEVAGVAVNSKKHIFVYSRGGSSKARPYGNTASQLLEFDQNGVYLREIGKNLYAWAFAIRFASTRTTTSGATDKGADMVIKFSPEGRVEMVFGRKTESSMPTPTARAREPAAAGGGWSLPAADRRDLGSAGQHLHQRRLYQFARRQARQEWRLDQVVGPARQGPGRVQPGAHHRRRRARQHLCRRPHQPAHPGVRWRGHLQARDQDRRAVRSRRKPAIGNKPDLTNYLQTGGTFAPGAPWALCITPGPNQVLYSSDSYPGRIYKLSLDGQVRGYLGKSGKQPKHFGWIHEIACPSENELYVAEILNWRVQKLILRPGPVAAEGGGQVITSPAR